MKKIINKIIKTNHSPIKTKVLTLSLVVLLIDFFTKELVMNNLKLEHDYQVIKNFFYLFYTKNTGAAFSILTNHVFLLIIVALIVLVLLNNYISKLKKASKLEIISLGLIIGGMLGNLLDRIIYKSVIDFISINIFNYRFPVFNLADVSIVVGAILLIISLFKEDSLHKKTK